MKHHLTIITICLALLFSCKPLDTNSLMNGDIIFHESTSSQGEELKLATDSIYTHMGIIYIQNNDHYVLEAVQPVKLTPLSDFIKRGRNNHYVVKRLHNADSVLTEEALQKMKKIGTSFIGKDYDIYFRWDDSRIYCSELVWKIYKRALNIELCELEKFGDFDLTHPKVKKIINQRFGSSFPINETVVSPKRIFESDLLTTIF